jgi:L-lactate dehydrogenase (cytochrome)
MSLADSQTYLYFNRVQLEANTPVDAGHTGKADGAKKGRPGRKVSVRDVLAKKDSNEIWVVIKGEVYE